MRLLPAVALAGRASLWLFLVPTACLIGGGASSAASITDTVRAALAFNPELAAVKADRRAVDQELRQALAGYLPSIDARAAIGGELSSNPATRRRGPGSTDRAERIRSEAQIKLSQMLFDGFATQAEVERQTARVDSAAYRVQEAAEFIAVDAIEAHLEVLRNQQIVALNRENVAAHERILRQVRSLERAGRADVADVQQTQARLANAQASLAQAEGALADAIAFYQRVVGREPQGLTLDAAPVRALPKDRETAARLASVQSPTVLIAAADVDVAAAELRGSRAGYYPRIDAELTADVLRNAEGTTGPDASASAMLVLRYNLFRGGADIAREREAFHRLNEARAQLLKQRVKAEELARQSFNAYETAKARVVAQRARVEAQRRTRDAYASQFELGQRDLLDVLDAENELFLARVQLVTAEFTERFAVYKILGVVGTLLDTLEVARPKEHINVYRSAARQQTPAVVTSKSEQLSEPRSEPRALRSGEAGEPPAAQPDAADAINKPVKR
ncbi:MAG: TolC family outer membrane protein [Geminicoccaceae bacterium]|nr:TolC family outer membrane protein [Geminicoccaceae bacterium]MDW8123191.1 TolC family outer membrane protein [Geminicoccaceae bacterium]